MTNERNRPSAERAPVRHSSLGIHHSAFSLVELLVVIGILSVLITLAVVGFKVVGRSAREKVTNNQLENCKGLLEAFEETSSDDQLMSPLPVTVLNTGTPMNTDRWIGFQQPVTTKFATAQLPAISNFAAEETARVIARLRSVPANRASLEKMSADKIKLQMFQPVVVPAATFTPSGTLPGGQSVVLLDGTGNPIYFVPGGGLVGVNLGYDGKSDPSQATSYSNANTTIRSPDGRPFWVSPGPDGNLTTGDDNIYSFGN